ncbi:MAG: SBBP repeat-containing protein [Candidatus Sulfotelmatobacter sp.]
MSDSFARTQSPANRVTRRGGAIPVALFAAALMLIGAFALRHVIPTGRQLVHQADSRGANSSAGPQSGVLPAVQSQYMDGRLKSNYASLPLAFEPNVGQSDAQVKYVARGRGYSLFLASNAAYFAIPFTARQEEVKPSLSGKAAGVRSELDRFGAVPVKHNAVASIEMDLPGSNSKPEIVAENQLPGVTNYILGRDPSQWHGGVAHYGQVRYRDIYPGIDLAYHGASLGQDKFEFDFLVNPGVNPENVKLEFPGLRKLRTTATGDLVLPSAAGDLHLHRPVAYQETNGIRQAVDARFVVHENRVSFSLGTYDRSRQLVIDPTVTYSTYLGGSAEDDAISITADASGNAYITGKTHSTNFSGAAGATVGGFDVFVTELTPSGTLVFTTLIGGTSDDVGNAIAVDTAGSPAGIYVAGQTKSTDFPTTGGAVQPTFNTATTVHGFALKLAANGSALTWCTFIEGSGGESALGLAIVRDAVNTTDDDVYVVGSTQSADLGVSGTVNPLPHGATLNNGAGATGFNDGFIAKIANGGGQYLFLSYLGGSSDDTAFAVAADPLGNIYVAGQTSSADFFTTPSNVIQPTCGSDGTCNASGGNVVDDAFVTAITPGNTPTYIYSTFLGGEAKDDAFAIAADSAGNAYVTGQTFSTQFPMKNPLTQLSSLIGTQDIFVSSLNSTGTALNYSTYLGGTGTQAGDGIAVDGSGNAYVTGYTTSSSFPVTLSTSTFGKGGIFGTDAFVSELNLSGTSLSLPFSTYLGGSGDEDFISGAIAVDGTGNIYVTGETNSSDFPLTNAADGTYNAGTTATCTPTSAGSVPCPDGFVTVYKPSASGDFSIAGSALAAVSDGSSSTSTITVTPFNGYSNTVNLTCSVSGGGTPAPTCSLSAASVAVSGTTSQTSTLTVKALAATSELFLPESRRGGTLFYASLLPVFGFALFGLGSQTAKGMKGRMLGLFCLLAILGALLVLPACGGGGSGNGGGGGGGGGGTPGTPSGTYTITVTGTDGTITHSIAPPLTLTVN